MKLPKSFGSIHPVFHVSLLEPYYQRPGAEPREPPGILIDGETEYLVEAILDKRTYYGKVQYLVKWEGYADTENSWEPSEHLENAQDLIDEYERANRNRFVTRTRRQQGRPVRARAKKR